MVATYCAGMKVVLLGGVVALAACSGSGKGISTSGSGGSDASTQNGTGGQGTGGSIATGSGGSSTTGTGGNSASGGALATGGRSTSGTGGVLATGGSSAIGTGGNPATGGSSVRGTGGSPATGGSGAIGTGGVVGSGGRTTVGSGGGSTSSGAGGAISTGGSTSTPAPLDCGPIGQVIYNAGPPKNRVNYVILADGYTTATVDTTLQTHITNAMNARFSVPIGEPYTRYKNFVNICLFKTISANDGVSQTGASTGSTIFNCRGDDTSRLATCDTSAAATQLKNNTPAGMTVDWHSIVLNNTKWWNTGSTWMLWSGGNADGPKGALHEGGHGFHQLADEYGTCTGATCGSNTSGTGTTGTEYAEVNSTGNPATTGGKWDLWIGYTQAGATGLQGTWSGSRYVGSGQYRPSANSMMNSLFGTNVNTSFNPASREQMIMTIWRYVKPIDSTEPAAGAVSSPGILKVSVIDPAVISVDWTVDGTTTVDGGTTFDTQALAAGSHTVSAKAYDNANTDWVCYKTGACPTSVTGNYCSRTAWPNSQQTVTWTFTK
jgi:IgA Peptidase M64